jgi:hypothetical protein
MAGLIQAISLLGTAPDNVLSRTRRSTEWCAADPGPLRV